MPSHEPFIFVHSMVSPPREDLLVSLSEDEGTTPLPKRLKCTPDSDKSVVTLALDVDERKHAALVEKAMTIRTRVR